MKLQVLHCILTNIKIFVTSMSVVLQGFRQRDVISCDGKGFVRCRNHGGFRQSYGGLAVLPTVAINGRPGGSVRIVPT